MRSPVSNSSIAYCQLMRCGSRIAPTMVGTPMVTSGKPNSARSLAITKSHQVTSVNPYPMQYPFTAAITGLKISQPLSNELTVGFSQNVPANSPVEPAPSRRSAPAQKAAPRR